MRILEINKFNHVRGGADKHFVDLARLLELSGNEVAVFAMDHPENRQSEWSRYFVSRVDYEKGNIPNKIKGALRIFWSFEAKRKISKLLDEFKPDIVHIHNIYHQISPSILPEIKRRGIPIVMTVHDWKLVCPNYLLNCGAAQADGEPYCRKCVRGTYWHCLKNKCVKNSYFKSLLCVLELYFHKWLKVYEKNVDLYVAPSRFVKKVLLEAGFPDEKIKVLPHFINRRDRIPTTFAEPDDDYALYFGRISKEKNVDELVEIFKNLPIELVLAGNKDENFNVPAHSNIKFVGFKNPNELESLIRNSKFVVSASRLPETFGLIALEATKNGRPFVGYDTGAYGEIIQNGPSGHLAADADDFREKITEYASGNMPEFSFDSEKFSPENHLRSIIDIFGSIC